MHVKCICYFAFFDCGSNNAKDGRYHKINTTGNLEKYLPLPALKKL